MSLLPVLDPQTMTRRARVCIAVVAMVGLMLAVVPTGAKADPWAPATEIAAPANAASNPTASVNHLACQAANVCVAVGSYLDNQPNDSYNTSTELEGLSETNGVWSATTQILPPSNANVGKTSVGYGAYAEVDGLACPPAGDCVAAGSYVDSSGDREPMIVTESGGTWTASEITGLPSDAGPTGDVDAQLGSVACDPNGSCVAFGNYYTTGGTSEDIISTGTAGGTWSTTAFTAGGPVTCAAVGMCVTVGSNLDYSTNGVWQPVKSFTAPANAGTPAFATFDAVACQTNGDCAGVGTYNGNSKGSLDGQGMGVSLANGVWSATSAIQLPGDANATPADGPDVGLPAVACPPSGPCVAVGGYLDDNASAHGGEGNDEPLVVSESNGVWSPGTGLTAPANAPAGGGGLQAVVCPASGSCQAVGSYQSGSTYQEHGAITATETDGQWGQEVVSTLPVPAAVSPQNANLNSVACPGSGNCVAIGSYTDGQGNQQGMAMLALPASSTTLSVSPASAVTNQAVTLTATVTGGGGTVAFENGGTAITGCGAQTLAQSGPQYVATCETTFTAATSPESLTAVFTPSDPTALQGSAGGASYAVGVAGTSANLTASSMSPELNAYVTYTAIVTPAVSGAEVPSGAVEFMDGGVPVGACQHQPLGPMASGAGATCTVSYPTAGTHAVTATYLADANFGGSTSGQVVVNVQAAPPGVVNVPAPTPAPAPAPAPVGAKAPTVAAKVSNGVAKVGSNGSVTLGEKVSGPGTVTATATVTVTLTSSSTLARAVTGGAKTKTRTVKYATATVRATKAGTVTLVLKPTRAALAALKAHHMLRLKVTVRFTPQGSRTAVMSPRTISVTYKPVAKKTRRRQT